MNTKLGPYPKYKDSGIPWLGQIPEHWDVRRNGRLFAQRNETGFGELPILEVSLRTGVRVRDMDNLKRKQVMSDAEKYKRAAKGDIAYNMMRMWQGALGTAPVDGLVSPAYVVARPFEETNPYYYSYLFRTEGYKAEVDGYSRGIVKDRNRLYWQDFKRMPSCFPPPKEQSSIVQFLDANAHFVRQFIRNRRRLIDLLAEQKQAIINRYVTRGIDPKARRKESGVDWIGEIPTHWERKKLKFLSRITYGISPNNSTYNADGVGTLLINGPDEYSEEDFGYTRPIKWTTSPTKFAPKDALLFCLRGSTTGRLNICHDRVSIGRGVAALVPSGSRAYFTYAMMALRSHLKSTFRGSTFPSVTAEQLNNYVLTNPPPEEQVSIASHIQEETQTLETAIRTAHAEIGLIQMYRDRLVLDVVTGKIDTRDATISVELEVGHEDDEELLDDFDSDEEVNDGDD